MYIYSNIYNTMVWLSQRITSMLVCFTYSNSCKFLTVPSIFMCFSSIVRCSFGNYCTKISWCSYRQFLEGYGTLYIWKWAKICMLTWRVIAEPVNKLTTEHTYHKAMWLRWCFWLPYVYSPAMDVNRFTWKNILNSSMDVTVHMPVGSYCMFHHFLLTK